MVSPRPAALTACPIVRHVPPPSQPSACPPSTVNVDALAVAGSAIPTTAAPTARIPNLPPMRDPRVAPGSRQCAGSALLDPEPDEVAAGGRERRDGHAGAVDRGRVELIRAGRQL